MAYNVYLHVTDGYGEHKYYRNRRRISKSEFMAFDRTGYVYKYDRRNGMHYFRWSEP